MPQVSMITFKGEVVKVRKTDEPPVGQNCLFSKGSPNSLKRRNRICTFIQESAGVVDELQGDALRVFCSVDTRKRGIGCKRRNCGREIGGLLNRFVATGVVVRNAVPRTREPARRHGSATGLDKFQ